MPREGWPRGADGHAADEGEAEAKGRRVGRAARGGIPVVDGGGKKCGPRGRSRDLAAAMLTRGRGSSDDGGRSAGRGRGGCGRKKSVKLERARDAGREAGRGQEAPKKKKGAGEAARAPGHARGGHARVPSLPILR